MFIWEVSQYSEAVEYILGVPKFTTKSTMEETRHFYQYLGKPGSQAKMIHVAGTNGKGSVCAYLRSVLVESGRSVGLFTSPHLEDIRERIQIGSDNVGKAAFFDAFCVIRKALQEINQKDSITGKEYHPTFFEFLFFLGMLVFQKEKVEYIVLETGMGGRLDATNVIEHPEIAIITEIGYDHTEYLGTTLEEIAGEKAGIMKEGVPVVFLDTKKEVSEVIKRRAQICQAKAVAVSRVDRNEVNIINKHIDFSIESRYYKYIKLKLDTCALYQVENALLAVRAIEEIDGGKAISQTQLEQGIQKAQWKGRMEEICPRVFLDGAHNEDGIAAFLETVIQMRTNGRKLLLFSAVADKKYEAMIELLLESHAFEKVVAAEMNNSRKVSNEQLKRVFEKYGEDKILIFDTVEEAYQTMVQEQNNEDLLFITGSLYLVGQVRSYIRKANHD